MVRSISLFLRRKFSSNNNLTSLPNPTFLSCLLPHKSFIKIIGPDATKFLNGLVTSKLIPTYIKKNLTTIPSDEEIIQNQIKALDTTLYNWGLYKEGRHLEAHISRFGTYTGLLNSKGKIITDTIIYPTPICLNSIDDRKYPEYLLELDTNIIDNVKYILESHRLSSKVKLSVLPNNYFKSWYVSIDLFSHNLNGFSPWENNFILPMTEMKSPQTALDFSNYFLNTFFKSNEKKVVAVYFDSRILTQILKYPNTVSPVFRIVTKPDVSDISDIIQPSFTNRWKSTKVNYSNVRKERFERGILEGATEYNPETLLPMELNFDRYEDAISFNKGCYIGQELSARTFSTGVLRKRIVPITVDNPHRLKSVKSSRYLEMFLEDEFEIEQEKSLSNPFQKIYRPTSNKNRRSVAYLIDFEHSYGIALIRKDHMDIFIKRSDKKLKFYINDPENNDKITLTLQNSIWVNPFEEK